MLIENKKDASNKTSWRTAFFYIIEGNNKKFFTALSFGILSSTFISVANPLTIKYLFDEGIIRGNFKLFIILGICSVLVFTLWRIFLYFYRLKVQQLKISITKKFCHQMVARYYDLPYDEIIKKDNGYFLSRLYDEIVSTVQPAIDTYLSFFNTIITILVALVVIIFMSWRASLVIIITTPIVYLVSRKYGGKIKDQTKIEKEEEANLRGVLTRVVDSHKPVNIFNLGEKVFRKIDDTFDIYAAAFTTRFKTGVLYDTLSGILMSYAETIAMIGGGYEILSGRLSFGGFMGFMNAYWMVIGSIRGLFSLIPELSRITGSVERIREFETFDNQIKTIIYSNNIQLEHVGFAYDQKNVIQNFDLDVYDGERILIIGSNGSGKSTLAHLIAGLLTPSTGRLKTFPLKSVSASIVPGSFIPGTIKDNTSFVTSDNKSELLKSLFEEFELNTHLDHDPVNLSAGQRKKLEIIMGLIKDAEIYIFDEPLAGVDTKSKDKVMSRIIESTKNKTLIVIMHGDEQFHELFDRRIELGVVAKASNEKKVLLTAV